MRAVVQRVLKSSVEVDGQVVGSINKGFNVLLGIETEDTLQDVAYLAEKVLFLRVFEDEEEKMNLSLKEVDGEVLCVSQFTLMGDCRKGRRPNFMNAAKPDQALTLYEAFVSNLENQGIRVATGVFQADMKVSILNDGPVTVLLDSKKVF